MDSPTKNYMQYLGIVYHSYGILIRFKLRFTANTLQAALVILWSHTQFIDLVTADDSHQLPSIVGMWYLR